MTISTLAEVTVAVIAVLTFVIKLYKSDPQILRALIESLVAGVPYFFIPRNLIIAIILFTLFETYSILKDVRKPGLSVVDAYCATGLLCLHSGIFAAFVVYVRL